MKELISFLAIWFDNFKRHTFKVDVGLAEKLQTFSRELLKLDTDLKDVISAIQKLEAKDINADVRALLEKIAAKEIIFPKIDIPKRVEIANFPRQVEFPKSIEVSNLPQVPSFPESIEVSNFPSFPEPKAVVFPQIQKVVGNVQVENQISLEEVIKGLQTVVDVINDLKLEMPKSFATSITSSSSVAPRPLEYKTNDVDDTSQTNIVYVGKETSTGVWMVTKINTASGAGFTYATPQNNTSITSYSLAWSGRLSLTYNIFSTAK